MDSKIGCRVSTGKAEDSFPGAVSPVRCAARLRRTRTASPITDSAISSAVRAAMSMPAGARMRSRADWSNPAAQIIDYEGGPLPARDQRDIAGVAGKEVAQRFVVAAMLCRNNHEVACCWPERAVVRIVGNQT